jgi:hypothetical protein
MEPESSLPCSQKTATDPILSQMNTFYILSPCFFKIQIIVIIIILPSTSRPQSGPFPINILVYVLYSLLLWPYVPVSNLYNSSVTIIILYKLIQSVFIILYHVGTGKVAPVPS